MPKKIAAMALLLPFLAVRTVSAQGINTPANQNDWEEINFDFNSAVLVDGFPTLLRIADLLKKNPAYKLQVEGHADAIGRPPYNQQLGLRRANTVRDFLVQRGMVPAAQIAVTSAGNTRPKVNSTKQGYSATDEGRFMNRRVVLTVLDQNGNTIGDACDMVRTGCCEDLSKRMTTLEGLINNLIAQNKLLTDALELIRIRVNKTGAEVDAMDPKVDDIIARLTRIEAKLNGGGGGGGAGGNGAAGPAGPPGTPGASAKDIVDEIQKRNPKFELLGLNAGGNGDATATAKGRFFSPFGEHYALQSEGEYFYSRGQREGQFDIGLVDRVGRFQAGLFSSFKHVNLTGDQTGGTLGQGAATLEYLFKWGKIGAFGTKAFLDDALVNSTPFVTSSGILLPDFVQQRYLRVVDQGGISATAPLFGKNYFEGNLGYLRSTTAGDRVGGTLRLIFPMNDNIAFTLEGGMNETLLGRGNTGRVVAGVQFGNFMRPRELLAANHATPVQIPRVRYEILTRTLRVGHLPPVADAGPNQTLQGPATVTLDGSNSSSPDGDKLTYQWSQQSGPPVSLSAPTSAVTTFSAAAGQVYVFQLTVRDSVGAQGTARVTITATTAPPPQILFFTALPGAIQAGQSSTLAWQVINADTVSISTIGSVVPTGSVQVSPTTATVYTITATKGSITVTASAAVTIVPPPGAPGGVKIVSYTQQVLSDGMTQLYCITENAVSIMLNGKTFPFTTEAVLEVNPPVPTQYPCVATGFDGTIVTQTLTVQ